jgi:ComF family protein
VSFSSLLFPIRCAICERPGEALCDACRSRLRRLGPPLCERCGSPGAWPVRRCAECAGRRLGFARAHAAIVYDEQARALVSAWKERGRRDLGAIAAALIAETIGRPDVDALVPVPADPWRARRRGHVPPARLAEELGVLWAIPVLELLRRDRGAPRQRALGLRERRQNLRGAFAPSGPGAPRRVCVIDDVYTSGSTVSAAGSALRKLGATRVEAVCFARAIR